jgi:hypothetical protein
VTADPSFVDAYGNTYEFMFWNVDATPYATEEVNFETLCTSASTATAWFVEKGSGSGPSQIDTWAFSLNQNGVIPNQTPIQSVTNGTWAGGSSTVVFTTGTLPGTITAMPKIPPYGRFTDWEPDRDRIARLGHAAPSALAVHQALQRQPIATAASLVKATGLSAATVNKSLAHLERIGVVGEITNRQRGRVFSYGKYVKELVAEMESP